MRSVFTILATANLKTSDVLAASVENEATAFQSASALNSVCYRSKVANARPHQAAACLTVPVTKKEGYASQVAANVSKEKIVVPIAVKITSLL